MPIKAGDRVRILPQFQDPGDDQITFIAVNDEVDGRVMIEAQLDMTVNPTQVVLTSMLGAIE